MSNKKIKVIAAVLVFILIFGTVFGLVAHYSNWFTNWDKFNPQNWGKKDDSEQQQTQVTGGSVLKSLTNNGLLCVSDKIAYADYAENGIAEGTDSAYTLTATIKPDIANNKRINWSARFSNINSSWASDKDISDYLTFSKSTTQSGESVVLSCLQDFGEQIIVTASADADNTKKATCSVDYMKRIKRIDYSFTYDNNALSDVAADSDGVYRFDFTRDNKLYAVVPTAVYSNYTIDVTYSSVVSGKFTDTFVFGNGVTLSDITLSGGLTAPIGEPELSANAKEYCNKVSAFPDLSNATELNNAASTIRNLYSGLSSTDKSNSKVQNAYSAFQVFENCSATSDFRNAKKAEMKAILNSYTPPPTTYTFMQSNIPVTSMDDFLQNALACNKAGKGVVEYTIKYSSGDFVYSYKLALGFTSKSLQAVMDIEIDNGEIIV